MMLREGGESRNGTNINFLLEEYGIISNNGKGLTAIFSHQFAAKLKGQVQLPHFSLWIQAKQIFLTKYLLI